MSIRYSEARLPTAIGMFRLRVYDHPRDAGPIAIIGGERFNGDLPLVRIHSGCFAAENLASVECECRERLDFALDRIADGGIVVYLRRAPMLLRFGAHGAVDGADLELAAMVLSDLGVGMLRLLTDSPDDAAALGDHGLHVTDCVPLSEPMMLRTAAGRFS
jgi:GTP cyclohydrolase II